MAVLPLVIAPDPRLKVKCRPVAVVDDGVRRLLDDMLDTMYARNGIGLAAPQVGDSRRVIVADVAREGAARSPLLMVNPEIVKVSDHDKTWEEGCLSLPEHYADVVRPAEVTVRYLDRDGERREVYAEGVLSVCLQHEIDHLDGILFVDHVSALRRNMILRKLVKQKRLMEQGAA